MARDWKVGDRPRVVRASGAVEYDWSICLVEGPDPEDRVRLVKDGLRMLKTPRRSTLDLWQVAGG